MKKDEIKKEVLKELRELDLTRKSFFDSTPIILDIIRGETIELTIKKQEIEVLKLIEKFKFRDYSLLVNPILEKNEIRQLKEDLKQKIKGVKNENNRN